MPPAHHLFRPYPLAFSGGAVLLGAVLAVGVRALTPDTLGPLALAVASVGLVHVGSSAFREARDAVIDRQDRLRALGGISVRTARGLWAGLSALAVGLAVVVDPVLGLIALASVAGLWLHAVVLRGTPGPGNVVVAAMAAAAPLYGAFAVGRPTPAVWGAAGLLALLTLAHELTGDVDGTSHGRAEGERTLPIVLGERRAAALALGTTVAALAVVPSLTALDVAPTLLAYGLPCAACLLAAGWMLGNGVASSASGARRASARAQAWLKGAVATGIMALILTRLG